MQESNVFREAVFEDFCIVFEVRGCGWLAFRILHELLYLACCWVKVPRADTCSFRQLAVVQRTVVLDIALVSKAHFLREATRK